MVLFNGRPELSRPAESKGQVIEREAGFDSKSPDQLTQFPALNDMRMFPALETPRRCRLTWLVRH